MRRFSAKKKRLPLPVSFVLSFAVFSVMLMLLVGGAARIEARSQTEQLESLKTSVTRAAVHCYAIEGVYPTSIEELEDRYGLSYDHNKYIVKYTCFASNLMPDITVISKTND